MVMVFNDNLSEDDRGKLRVLLIHKTLNPFVGQDWKVTLSFFLPGCYQKPFLLLELLLSLLGFGSIALFIWLHSPYPLPSPDHPAWDGSLTPIFQCLPPLHRVTIVFTNDNRMLTFTLEFIFLVCFPACCWTEA